MSDCWLGSESDEIDEVSHSRNQQLIKFLVDKKNVAASSLDKKQHQTREITSVQGQNLNSVILSDSLTVTICTTHGKNMFYFFSPYIFVERRVRKSLWSC